MGLELRQVGGDKQVRVDHRDDIVPPDKGPLADRH
jgi:hypothetical protein